MANEQLFTQRAQSYASGRMGYADRAIDQLFAGIVKPHDVIADVGAGTGIFAKVFIERGYDTYCVEPNANMRRQAEAAFHGDPHFHSVAAPAEATTLPDHSIDLVTAASAFHWFDAVKFRAECLRILKPQGIVFTILNCRDYNDPFTLRQHELCEQYCLNFSSLRHGLDKSEEKLKTFLGANLNRADFEYPLLYKKDQFVQRSLSSSYAPAPDTAAYDQYAEALWALMDEFAPDSGQITVPNVSVAHWGKLD